MKRLLFLLLILQISLAQVVMLFNTQGLETLGIISGTSDNGKPVFHQVGLYDGYTINLPPGLYVVRARVPGLGGMELNQVKKEYSTEIQTTGERRNLLRRRNTVMYKSESTRFKVVNQSGVQEVEFKVPLKGEIIDSHVVDITPID